MQQERTSSLSRRAFLTFGLGAAASVLITDPLAAAIRPLPERRLSLYNTHTGERLNTVYWAKGRYVPESVSAINRLLRDHRSGQMHHMDPRVLDLVSAIHRKLGNKGMVHIISGYRSPQTNAMLASLSDGVACNSLHMQGKAIDISIPGQSVRNIGQAAASFKAGGVGIYPNSHFVHVDTGRVRRW